MIPELSLAEACKFLLSIIEGYRQRRLQSANIVDPSFLRTRLCGGIRNVQGDKDPLSNMWTGPVYFDGNLWPTREHAIVATEIGFNNLHDETRNT